ncbi:MAG: DMT family protein [Flavobacteriales bacterium]
MQEVISLSVFFVLALSLDEKAEFKFNHAAAGLRLVAAVYFIF